MTDLLQKRFATVAGRIAGEALSAGRFDSAVTAKAKLCLIDYLACALESRDLPWAAQAAAIVADASPGAALIGRTRRASAGDAAFANAVAGHGLVREDMHTGSIAHLGVVVWPAIMAVAATRKVSGAALIDAAIVGYEVGARIGRALMTAELARLFRPTGLVGAMAAAVAVSRLYGLSADQTLNALSLAANASGGLNQWPHTGGSEMYFHPGFAARSGIMAADLAKADAIASDDILEGEAGLFRAYARRPLDGGITLFSGGTAEILSVFNKAVPACNFAQTPCQAALEASGKRDGHRVESIHIAASDAALRYPGCNAAGPFDYALQAKMSILFGVAAAIARGAIAEDNYSRLDDPEIARLIGVTTLVADPAYTAAFPGRQGATVTLGLANGAKVSASLDDVVPADPELIRSRFVGAASAVLGAAQADQMLNLIDTLENEPDCSRLDALCAPSGAAAPLRQAVS